MSKILTAYFSAGGTTRRAAEAIAQAVAGDLYEIRPQVPYCKADLDWENNESRSSQEMRDRSSRPAIALGDLDIAPYDRIFLGFPIWWYVAPTLINTFLESYDFTGKTIILFATAGGSGFGNTLAGLKASLGPGVIIKEGRVFKGRPKQEDLAAWLEELAAE